MSLAFTLVGEAQTAANPRYVAFLHGILGSRSNWKSIARKSVKGSDWVAVLVDLRLHGDSQQMPGLDTVEAAAHDLGQLPLELSALVGHSFGGKVALMRSAQKEIERIMLVDSVPGAKDPYDSDATKTLAMLASLPPRFSNRDQFVDAVVERGYPAPIAQWLAMNLESFGGGFRLRLDLDALNEMLDDYFGLDLWPILERRKHPTTVLLGGASPVFDTNDRSRVRDISGHVAVEVIEGAGHWVHVERPNVVIESVRRFLEL